MAAPFISRKLSLENRRNRSFSMESQSGVTAIEVMISLVVLSFVAAFSLQAFEYARRSYLDVEQLDFATQIARDILNQLKTGEDWRVVRDGWQKKAWDKGGTRFEVQISGEAGEEERVSNVEVTIIWIGTKGLQQEVFNTSVFDTEAGT